MVSRGEAAGFYHSLGFQLLPWLAVAAEHQEESDLCPERNQYGPEARWTEEELAIVLAQIGSVPALCTSLAHTTW